MDSIPPVKIDQQGNKEDIAQNLPVRKGFEAFDAPQKKGINEGQDIGKTDEEVKVKGGSIQEGLGSL